ncbi:cysteine hydrolase family protein [Shouchella lonarensis]|nr:isochorismatase family protein [Shouchella lonarensis]
MKALLVIDVQQTFVKQGDFSEELARMNDLISIFKTQDWLVIFVKHISNDQDDPFYYKAEGATLSPMLHYFPNDHIIEKSGPSAFYHTDLQETLVKHKVSQLYITGFNSEFCCLFTAIAAYDRGYDVTFIEDATATVNHGGTYDTSELDVRDFIATVLDWSQTMCVCDTADVKQKLSF